MSFGAWLMSAIFFKGNGFDLFLVMASRCAPIYHFLRLFLVVAAHAASSVQQAVELAVRTGRGRGTGQVGRTRENAFLICN